MYVVDDNSFFIFFENNSGKLSIDNDWTNLSFLSSSFIFFSSINFISFSSYVFFNEFLPLIDFSKFLNLSSVFLLLFLYISLFVVEISSDNIAKREFFLKILHSNNVYTSILI